MIHHFPALFNRYCQKGTAQGVKKALPRAKQQKSTAAEAAVQEDLSYRYFFIASEAAAGSAEMVMVISMLFSWANFATHSTKASLAAWS